MPRPIGDCGREFVGELAKVTGEAGTTVSESWTGEDMRKHGGESGWISEVEVFDAISILEERQRSGIQLYTYHPIHLLPINPPLPPPRNPLPQPNLHIHLQLSLASPVKVAHQDPQELPNPFQPERLAVSSPSGPSPTFILRTLTRSISAVTTAREWRSTPSTNLADSSLMRPRCLASAVWANREARMGYRHLRGFWRRNT